MIYSDEPEFDLVKPRFWHPLVSQVPYTLFVPVYIIIDDCALGALAPIKHLNFVYEQDPNWLERMFGVRSVTLAYRKHICLN